jgi:hypothetical protein
VKTSPDNVWGITGSHEAPDKTWYFPPEGLPVADEHYWEPTDAMLHQATYSGSVDFTGEFADAIAAELMITISSGANRKTYRITMMRM